MTSRTPEIETIFEGLVDAIFNGALISVHVLHSAVDASVGKHDVVIAKCRVVVASSATIGMKSVHHSIFVFIHVVDSTILVAFNDVETIFGGQVVIAPLTSWTQRENLDIAPFIEILASHVDA